MSRELYLSAFVFVIHINTPALNNISSLIVATVDN